MLQQATGVNVIIQLIERMCEKHDIRLKESYKSIIATILPAIIYRDGSIIILSETIHQINKLMRKQNESFNFVSILIGYNCITNIDKYGAITIPLSILSNKLTIKREVVGKCKETHLSKKVLTNPSMTLYISQTLKAIGIPDFITIPIINIAIEYVNTDLEKEEKAMLLSSVAFKNKKMSEIKTVLKQMQFEKIFVSTVLLLIISNIGLSIGPSLILVSVLNELLCIFKAEYKIRTAKGFL